jgi:hypothetical protein
MKYLFVLLITFFSVNLCAQEDKTVALVVSGQGATQEAARQKALRAAIEQAFGVFISSKTEILNDNLVKDEIVSVANGNIQKFDIISETLLPNNIYASTLNATVSISKLTNFCQSKGINAEFKGGLFAMNIAMQELNEKNEKQAASNLYQTFIDILPQCLDYKIVPSEPVNENDKWKVQLRINFVLNKNYDVLTNYISHFIKSISMSEADINSYKSLNKPVYPLKINRDKSFEGLTQSELVIDTYYLRNQSTYNSIISYPYTILKYIISRMNFNNSIETQNIFTYMKKYANLDDKCLVTIESKMQFFRYLDNYSEYKNIYMKDMSTSMFQNSGINVNGGHLEISEGSPKSICVDHGSYERVYNAKTGTEDRVFNGNLFTSLTSCCYVYDLNNNKFNTSWFKEDSNSKVNVPGAPIFNIHGNSNKDFLNINISEYLTIEEIKKITEYKVMIN